MRQENGCRTTGSRLFSASDPRGLVQLVTSPGPNHLHLPLPLFSVSQAVDTVRGKPAHYFIHNPTPTEPMPQRTLHIGLNRVDSKHYGGWDGQLTACEFDAKDMAALCKARGFTRNAAHPSATATAVTGALRQAATNPERRRAGAQLLRPGGQVRHERRRTHGTDGPGVSTTVSSWTTALRVGASSNLACDRVFSDSCLAARRQAMPIYAGIGAWRASWPRLRAMPDAVRKTYARNKQLYDDIQQVTRKATSGGAPA